jgi:hypothetical protein
MWGGSLIRQRQAPQFFATSFVMTFFRECKAQVNHIFKEQEKTNPPVFLMINAMTSVMARL